MAIELEISKKKWKWSSPYPFSVDGTLVIHDTRRKGKGDRPILSIALRVGDRVYAVNGIARCESPNYRDLEEVWLGDPVDPGLRVSITPVIQMAQEAYLRSR